MWISNRSSSTPPLFLEEGVRRVNTLLHFERRARVASKYNRSSSPPSSISGGGRASRQNTIDCLPPLLHFGRRARVASIRVDTLLHFGRRARVASNYHTIDRLPPLLHFGRRAHVALIPSSILGGGRASHRYQINHLPPPPFWEEGKWVGIPT